MTSVQDAVLSLLPRLSSSPSPIPFFPDTTAVTSDTTSPIQQAQDILVRAKTGTGKTLAFLIPALEGRLNALESYARQFALENPTATNTEGKKALAAFAKNSCGALILSPTRELATQIANEAIALTTHLPQFGVRLLVGGSSRSIQLREWHKAPSNDIVVATPGRCVDLIESESMVRNPLSNTRMLILDEADTLLDMGFADDIATVSRHLPENSDRQTFLFSATVSKSIREVARKSMKKDHVFVDTVGKDDVDTHLHIPQYHTVLPTADHQITHILKLLAHDQLLHARKSAENGGVGGGKAIIFLPTTKMTQLYSSILSSMKNHLPWGRDTLIVEIHSKKDQTQRSRASDMFRQSTAGYSILVSSDVSARGVDYPGVTRVIQVGVPGTRDLYIHRVGRTGRAGKAGRGDLVLLPWEIGFLSWQLNDLPLKPFTISETERELTTLSNDWDSNPSALVKATADPSSSNRDERRSGRSMGGGGRPDRRSTAPRVMDTTTTARLSTLSDSLTTNVLPTLDALDVRETFASLLGYYITKAHELRTTKDVVVQGLKVWATQAMGLEEEPFVSDSFLQKMGMNDGRTKNRGSKMSGGYRGFGGGDSGSSRGGGGSSPWEGRGRTAGRDDRGGRSDRPAYGASRGGDRDSRPSYGDRSSSKPSYGDRSSSYGSQTTPSFGSSSADSWEKPDRSSGGGGGFSSGRSDRGGGGGGSDRGRRSY
jgi:ATP-dependent RNA helicase MSS116